MLLPRYQRRMRQRATFLKPASMINIFSLQFWHAVVIIWRARFGTVCFIKAFFSVEL